jgi:hypothetical protein
MGQVLKKITDVTELIKQQSAERNSLRKGRTNQYNGVQKFRNHVSLRKAQKQLKTA